MTADIRKRSKVVAASDIEVDREALDCLHRMNSSVTNGGYYAAAFHKIHSASGWPAQHLQYLRPAALGPLLGGGPGGLGHVLDLPHSGE